MGLVVVVLETMGEGEGERDRQQDRDDQEACRAIVAEGVHAMSGVVVRFGDRVVVVTVVVTAQSLIADVT